MRHAEGEEIMNNERHPDDCEEEVGANHHIDGDLLHEETIATL